MTLTIEPMYEIDGGWVGDTIGYYCDGHCDKQAFFSQTVLVWQEDKQELVDDGVLESFDKTQIPFGVGDIKQAWYRYPTDEELENGDADLSEQFIFFPEESENVKPITYVEVSW